MKAASTFLLTLGLAAWPHVALAQIRPQRERVDLVELGAVAGLFVAGVVAYLLTRDRSK